MLSFPGSPRWEVRLIIYRADNDLVVCDVLGSQGVLGIGVGSYWHIDRLTS